MSGIVCFIIVWNFVSICALRWYTCTFTAAFIWCVRVSVREREKENNVYPMEFRMIYYIYYFHHRKFNNVTRRIDDSILKFQNWKTKAFISVIMVALLYHKSIMHNCFDLRNLIVSTYTDHTIVFPKLMIRCDSHECRFNRFKCNVPGDGAPLKETTCDSNNGVCHHCNSWQF